MNTSLHWDSLPADTRRVLEALNDLSGLSDFYLAGGTALALQIGLRYFEDAENDPRELLMRRTVRWRDVKKYCEAGARLLTKHSTGLTPKGL